jgi:large subunit ribosomal protein L18
MANSPTYKVKFRRRRENITDYRKRLALLKSGLPRAVVRKTLRRTIVQVVNYNEKGDETIVFASSLDLKKYGWNKSTKSVPAAYLTGYLVGKIAKAKGIESMVLDMGRQKPTKGGRLFASLKGLLDAGIEINHGEEIFPDEDRIMGKHLGDDYPSIFEEVKNKIDQSIKSEE